VGARIAGIERKRSLERVDGAPECIRRRAIEELSGEQYSLWASALPVRCSSAARAWPGSRVNLSEATTARAMSSSMAKMSVSSRS
jgi:hypothetical protein